MNVKETLTDDAGMRRMVTRIATEIVDANGGTDDLVLLGMRTRGEFLAKRIHEAIEKIEGADVPLGAIDVTLYRDDFNTRLKQPEVSVTDITFDISEKNVVLIDDVLFTGRTARSALCAVMDYGRPGSVRLCVFVDRGHRELPIAPNFVGKLVRTSANEEVRVRVKEHDGEDAIYLVDTTPTT
ncbi:MAG: bifunctional pyr operon transcriptional regulator/uracil phosphoribosyltransferase PyrR [Ignavibacteriales bacterium]|nr:bifunctional pyr operon transcriptional regulator/uracil phosphoribosyltransferase PyrR [Ignavibacteriales bacterium]